MTYAAITGWGMAVPARVATNEELASSITGVDPEWIMRRTGIQERRIAAPGETTSTLAASAGRRALERAGVDASDVDLIVVATCTPDHLVPATAPLVQHTLGAARAGAFDVNAACAGFLTALATADGFIRSGRAERALVIGAEVLSRFVDWQDPRTCVLFGDGAGAVVLERSDTQAGLLALTMGASGDGASLIRVAAGGSAQPASAQTVAERAHVVTMNGPEVYRAAVRIMSSAAKDVMDRMGLVTDDVDMFIAHQANQRIIDDVAARMNLGPERVFSNVARFGNTSAASVPIALCEAADRGLLQPGSRLVLSVVGAGLVWAAAVALWSAATVGTERLEQELTGARA